jgi:hypothetical protein
MMFSKRSEQMSHAEQKRLFIKTTYSHKFPFPASLFWIVVFLNSISFEVL